MYQLYSSFLFCAAICCLILPLAIIAQDLPSRPQLGFDKSEPVKDSGGLLEKRLSDHVTGDAIDLNNLGTKLTLEGRHEDAVKAFTKAIELAPEMSSFHINLSITYERQENLSDALGSARLAVQYGPYSERAYNQLCGIFFLQKNFYSAVDCYKKLDELLPEDEEVLSQLGASMIEIGHGKEAIEILEKVVRRDPHCARAYNLIGFAHFEKKRYEDAARAFKQAVETDPAAVLYRFNLGITQALQRNKPGALSQYRVLKTLDPVRARTVLQLIFRDQIVQAPPSEN